MKVLIAKSVAWLIAAIAAFTSYSHQVVLLKQAHLEPVFGIPGEWITPLTVDSLAIIALMIRMSDEVTDRTRKLAMFPLLLAGTMSIAANVATATNIVQVIVGVWTVGSYIVAESFVALMERKQAAKKQLATDEAPLVVKATVGTRKSIAKPTSAKAQIIALAAASPRPTDVEIAAKVGTKPSWVKHVLKTATSN